MVQNVIIDKNEIPNYWHKSPEKNSTVTHDGRTFTVQVIEAERDIKGFEYLKRCLWGTILKMVSCFVPQGIDCEEFFSIKETRVFVIALQNDFPIICQIANIQLSALSSSQVGERGQASSSNPTSPPPGQPTISSQNSDAVDKSTPDKTLQQADTTLQQRFSFLSESKEEQNKRLENLTQFSLTDEQRQAELGAGFFYTDRMRYLAGREFHPLGLTMDRGNLITYSKEGLLRYYLAEGFKLTKENQQFKKDQLRAIDDPPDILVEISCYFHVLKALGEHFHNTRKNFFGDGPFLDETISDEERKAFNKAYDRASQETEAVQTILFHLSNEYVNYYNNSHLHANCDKSNFEVPQQWEPEAKIQIELWRQAWRGYMPGQPLLQLPNRVYPLSLDQVRFY